MLSIGLPCNLEYFLCVYCIVPRLPRSAWSPRVIQSLSFTRNLGQLQAPGFSAPPLLGDFSPRQLCLPRPADQRGNYRGDGELPAPAPAGDGAEAAPALRLALSPSFRRGPGLDGEGVACQPVRRGRQRGSGRGSELTPCPKPRLQRGARYLSPDGTEYRNA